MVAKVVRSADTREDAARIKELGVVAQRFALEPDALLEILAHIACSVPAGTEAPEESLTEAEESAYRKSGGLTNAMPPLDQRASLATEMEAIRLAQEGVTVIEAAHRLQVTEGRIRQRITSGSLKGVKVGSAWRLPRSQFTESGELPGIAQVLAALPDDIHPVLLERFLTTPNGDLVVGGESTSPTQWLLRGGDPARVVELATDLTRLP